MQLQCFPCSASQAGIKHFQGHMSYFRPFFPRGSLSSEVAVLHLALMRSQRCGPEWIPELWGFNAPGARAFEEN